MVLNVSVLFITHCDFQLKISGQFFGPLQGGRGAPTKRPKLEQNETNSPSCLETSLGVIEQDVPDDAMPGFHEEDEREDILEHEDDHTFLEDQPNIGPSRPRPPVSAPARPSLKGASTAGPSTKRRRASDAQRPQNASIESHECPICSTILETDNRGLNSHIDFCLSRGAIRQAHAEATTPAKKGGWQWPQPKPEAPRNVSRKRKPK